MFKLIIVDDEPIIRDGLKNSIDWNSLGFEVAATAGDVNEALDVYREHKPDAMLVDIKMPEKTGLELLRELKGENSQTEVILLSGYDDFNYAREGLKLGAFDYILKINMEEELENIFRKLAQKLEETRNQKQEYENLLDIKNNFIFLEFLKGEKTGLIASGQKRRRYQVSVIFTGNNTDNVYDLVDNNCSMLPYVMGKKDLYIISIYWHDEPEVMSRIFKTNIYNTYSLIKNNCGAFPPIIGIGDFRDNIEELPLCYRQAVKATDWMRLKEKQGVLFYRDIPPEEGRTAVDLQVKHNLLMGNYEILVNSIKDIFYEACINKEVLISEVQIMCTEILLKIRELISQSSMELNLKLSKYINMLKNLDSIIETEKWFTNIIRMISDDIQYIKKENQYQEVAKAKKYIDENFKSNLKMKDVAAAFFINSSYFSKKFKEMTGETFSQYVIGKKIDYACRLLKNTDMKIYEISREVGYEDQKHFSKLFSSHVNMTPREFRNKVE